jgi:hypothetical protein
VYAFLVVRRNPMNIQTVFTFNDGFVSTSKLDIEGFCPLPASCPDDLLRQSDVKDKQLQPFVNGNDETDIVYVVCH